MEDYNQKLSIFKNLIFSNNEIISENNYIKIISDILEKYPEECTLEDYIFLGILIEIYNDKSDNYIDFNWNIFDYSLNQIDYDEIYLKLKETYNKLVKNLNRKTISCNKYNKIVNYLKVINYIFEPFMDGDFRSKIIYIQMKACCNILNNFNID